LHGAPAGHEVPEGEGGPGQGAPDRRRDQGGARHGPSLLREAHGARDPGEGDPPPGDPLRAASGHEPRGGRLGARPHREGARLADPPPACTGVEGMREDSMAIRKLRNYVRGEWYEPRGARWLDVENPSTGGVIAQVPLSSPA